MDWARARHAWPPPGSPRWRAVIVLDLIIVVVLALVDAVAAVASLGRLLLTEIAALLGDLHPLCQL
eukprot:2332824-Pyramimonas_sp.AAC.1